MMETTISNATKSNWQRLHTSSEGRLAKRANKTLSTKKIVAASYYSSDNAMALLSMVSEIKAPVFDILYTLCLSKLEAFGLMDAPNVQNVMCDYKNCVRLNILVPDVWHSDDDILGFVLQSLLTEGERNSTGQYYTNAAIVRNMLNDLKIGDDETFFDPCCGSGAFLLGANLKNPNNIYGSEINPIAAMVAKVNLLCKYKDFVFVPHIYCADFLSDNKNLSSNSDEIDLHGRKFDYIYTNPPWGAGKTKTYFMPEISSKERASMFLVKSLQMLTPTGHLNFLLPTSLLKIQVHSDVRRYILEHCTIRNIELYNDRFDGVFTDYFSIKLDFRKADTQIYTVRKGDCALQLNYAVAPNQTDIYILPKNPAEESIRRKVSEKANDYLTHSKWALGIVTGNNKEKLFSERVGESEPIFTGKEIDTFSISKEKKYIFFDPANFQQCAKEEYYRAPEKLIYRFIANLPVVAYDDKQRLCLNSANILIPDVDTISIKSMAAFLNSALYQYLYKQSFPDFKVLKGNLSTLPFPAISPDLDRRLSNLVTRILEKGEKSELMQEINTEIFNLFDINDEERKFVMQSA